MEILLILLLIGALVAAAVFAWKASKAGAALTEATTAAATMSRHVASLQEQVQRLGRYQTIVDAEATAAALRAQAETSASQTRTEAEAAAARAVASARRDAERLVAEAQAAAAQARASAQALTAQARADATRILGEANRRADEIAGGALEALRDAKRLEQTAQAMKNVIEGYGDRYVMPTTGLLDDLAEEFGFAEAGQRLKAAREKVRSMIKQGTAATCDYVELNRRTTAIEFVLDAFNGKVDTILADVRHDNVGTLRQKIISNIGSFGEQVYKIGMTRRLDPLDRVHELGDASVPFSFDVHAMIPSTDAPALEHALHLRFVRNQVNKVNPRKEFFRVPLQDIRQEIERMGIDVTWTLAAEAREYCETQAIERALASKTLDEGAWLKAQAKAEAAVAEERERLEVVA